MISKKVSGADRAVVVLRKGATVPQIQKASGWNWTPSSTHLAALAKKRGYQHKAEYGDDGLLVHRFLTKKKNAVTKKSVVSRAKRSIATVL